MNSKSNVSLRTLQHNQEVRNNEDVRQQEARTLSEKRRLEIRDYKNAKRDNMVNMRNMLNGPSVNLAVQAKAITNDDQKELDSIENILDNNKLLLTELYKKILCTINNNQEILSMFPDLGLGIEIIISSIISPSDLTKTLLLYELGDEFLPGLETIRNEVTTEIETYLEEEYGLAANLNDVLTEVLSRSGACPYLCVSEAPLDDIINSDIISTSSTESFQASYSAAVEELVTPLGVIRDGFVDMTPLNTDTPSLENFAAHLASANYVGITDNPGVFKLNRLKREVKGSIIRNRMRGGRNYSSSLESEARLEYLDIFRKKTDGGESQPLQFIKDKKFASRKSIGKPLHMKLPTQSVIPVTTAGNRNDPEMYIVIMDDNFTPIETDMTMQGISRLNSYLHTNSGMSATGNPIKDVYRDMLGGSGNCEKTNIEAIYKMHNQLLENQFSEIFKSSMYGEYLEIKNVEQLYFLSFTRSLEGKRTNYLCVPKENLVHYALEYNDLGLGKTLLDDHKVLFSIRALLFYAKSSAYIRNSTDNTTVNIGLNPKDPDPQSTLRVIKSSILDLRKNRLPIGLFSSDDLTDWVQSCGLQIQATGNPRFPDVSIQYDKSAIQTDIPDSEFDEHLSKLSYMILGLKPENIDDMFGPDFSRQLLFNNSMLVKRIMIRQMQTNPQITKHGRILLYNDEIIRGKIKDILRREENDLEIEKVLKEDMKKLYHKDREMFYEVYLDRMSEDIKITLPSILDTMMDNGYEEFESYMDEMEKAVGYLVNSDMFPAEVVGESGENIDIIKAAILAYLAKERMSDKNLHPVLEDMFSTDKEKNAGLLSSILLHYKAVLGTTTTIISEMKDVRIANETDRKNIKEEVARESPETDEGGYSI